MQDQLNNPSQPGAAVSPTTDASNVATQLTKEDAPSKNSCEFIKGGGCTSSGGKGRRNMRKRENTDSKDEETTEMPSKKRKIQGLYATTKKDKPHENNVETQEVALPAEEDEYATFSSSRTSMPLGLADQGATRVLEIDPDEPEQKQGKITAAEGIEGAYKGLGGYHEYMERSHLSGMAKGSGIRAGPVKASSNIRVSCRFDYQPDICKDYHDTGYCGYGDNCKFVHDRGDYKSGWELEKEWDEQQAAKRSGTFTQETEHYDERETGDTDADSDLPFVCLKCKEKWKLSSKPVVTRCQHYFCEKCALSHFQKTAKCFVCKSETSGVFNIAHRIVRKLQQRGDKS